jgi:hypothetical protein
VLRLSKGIVIWGSLLFVSLPAYPCSCVVALKPNARTQMSDMSLVFRGEVLERQTLPERVEMRRARYAITFRVPKAELDRKLGQQIS